MLTAERMGNIEIRELKASDEAEIDRVIEKACSLCPVAVGLLFSFFNFICSDN